MDSQQLDQTTKLLRATFLTNLAVLRVHMPNVYEFFRDYTPTNVRLAFDAAGEINLVRDGLQIYPDAPRTACYEPGIQIISATLMVERREVANC